MFYLKKMDTMRRNQEQSDQDRRGYTRNEEDRDRNQNRYENPYRLHEQDHGNNSRRGNYRTDSNFNSEYGRRGDLDYDHQRDFNNRGGWAEFENWEERRPGGARYDGDDWYGAFNRSENQYGYVRQPESRSPYREYGLRDYEQDQENRRMREERMSDQNTRDTARARNSDRGTYGYWDTRSGQDSGRHGEPSDQQQKRPDFRDRRDDRFEQDWQDRRNQKAQNLREDRRSGY
jgi:hypothetical protein